MEMVGMDGGILLLGSLVGAKFQSS